MFLLEILYIPKFGSSDAIRFSQNFKCVFPEEIEKKVLVTLPGGQVVSECTFPGRVVWIPLCVVGVLPLAPPVDLRRGQDASVGVRTLVTPDQGWPDENVVVGLDRWNLRTPVNFFVKTDQVKKRKSLVYFTQAFFWTFRKKLKAKKTQAEKTQANFRKTQANLI